MSSNNIYFRYFVFSETQMNNAKKIANTRGDMSPEFGKVFVHGTAKTYTDIVASINNLRYSDSKIITSGDIRNIKYTQPTIDIL